MHWISQRAPQAVDMHSIRTAGSDQRDQEQHSPDHDGPREGAQRRRCFLARVGSLLMQRTDFVSEHMA